MSRKRRRASSPALRLATISSVSASMLSAGAISDGEHLRPVARVRAQNLEAVVVDAQRKHALAFARRAPRDQARETEMNVAAGERIEEKMPALARFQRLREQRLWRRQRRPSALHLDERARGRKLRLLVLDRSPPARRRRAWRRRAWSKAAFGRPAIAASRRRRSRRAQRPSGRAIARIRARGRRTRTCRPPSCARRSSPRPCRASRLGERARIAP